MTKKSVAWIVLAFAFAPSEVGAGEVDVEFIVEAPRDTPKDAVLHISGGAPALGNWSGSGVKLRRQDDGTWRGRVKLPDAQSVEFKITRGDWRSVEKDATGGEIANRKFTAASGLTVRAKVARWAEEGKHADRAAARPPAKSTRTGDIRLHEAFESRHLGNRRDILVYLPPDYDKRKDRYPVLYMHDGQNVFDAATSFLGIEWKADEHAERLIHDGRIAPMIIVAIANTPDRMNEYTMVRDESRGAGGRGGAYAKFLVEEVKPFIDRTYRTNPRREHTGVAGSSLGGLISLEICRRYPEVFSHCGVISPALMWNDDAILRELESSDNAWMKRVKFWVDMGTAEGRQIESFNTAVKRTRRLVEILDKAGLSRGRDYEYMEVEGGQHNEAAWAARFDRVLLFLYAIDESSE